MKKLLFFLSFILLISCEKEEVITLKLDQEIQPYYLKIESAKNDLLKDKFLEEAKSAINSKLKNENILDDYPLYFDNYEKLDNEYVLVNFRTPLLGELSNTKYSYKNFDRYEFNIIGKIKIAEAEKLNKELPCFVKGVSITKVPDDIYFISNLNFGNVIYDIKSVRN